MSNSGEDPNVGPWREQRFPFAETSNNHKTDQDTFRRNDVVYGMQGRYPPNVPQMNESYTVLPVGHGNFLKVYHSNENDAPTFNSYELFSSSSFIPPHTVRPPPTNNIQMQTAAPPNENTTNMIINQLVTSWTPNTSGTYSPFGEQQPPPLNIFDSATNKENINTEIINSQKLANESIGSVLTNKTKSPKTNGSFESSPGAAPEVKKRIVAEVKPMRMSYSDVLSKNVPVSKNTTNGNGNSNNVTQETTNNIKNSKYAEKTKPISNNSNEKRSSTSFSDDGSKQDIRPKKSDNGNQKTDDFNHSSSFNNSQKDKKKADENNRDNGNSKTSTKKPSQNTKSKPKNQPQVSSSENQKRRSNKRENDEDSFVRNNSKENDKEFFYNVTKNDANYERQQKPSQHPSTSKKTRSANTSQKNSSFRSEKQTFYTKRSQKPRKNVKYELIVKVAKKWCELMMKLLTWLFYLVYDIVVLGCGMVYDRLKQLYFTTCTVLVSFHTELKNNSGKPSAWIKNLFKKIDGKFSKGSKIAFWRRFYKKKLQEPESEFYKNGRLPQTGEEAMYSLLNCKGKDAYSILGVSPDCSQEQIRKHYKKIAVLVHPDKNKQPGAEEAFKVLQRAFELIGEPENRRSYDQSLDEALNAEKAWTELHDLLSQLQSKIAEAANTIRCSSCGLRHPRKLTERPHYAARECNSCKIKHSAREGDIWAETSWFGLRWKYLALMESKVYDITEWANCQKGALSHLQPNSHIVQYRIVRGGQQQQPQQQQQHEKERLKREPPTEPSLDDFLDNLYSGQNPQSQNTSRRRSKRN